MTDRRFWLGMTPVLLFAASAIGAPLFGLYAVFVDPSLRWEALFAAIVVWCAGQCLIMALPLLLPLPKPWERIPPPWKPS